MRGPIIGNNCSIHATTTTTNTRQAMKKINYKCQMLKSRCGMPSTVNQVLKALGQEENNTIQVSQNERKTNVSIKLN